MEHFQQSLQVAQYAHEQCPQQPIANSTPGVLLIFPGRRGSARHQVINQAKGSGQGQRKEGGDEEVVGDRCGQARQPGDHGHQHVAKVIVADTKAGEPWVLGRESVAAQCGVDEGDFHPLFAAGRFQVGVVRLEDGPGGECYGEEQLDRQPIGCVRPQPAQYRNLFVATTKVEPYPYSSHHKQGQQRPTYTVLPEAQTAAQPEQVAGQQQAQRTGKGVAPVRQITQ